MDVSFRPIVEDDFEPLCDLVASEEELFVFYDKGNWPLTVPQVRRLIGKRMEPTVMLHRGKVIGFGDFYNYVKGRSVFIGNIAIAPSARGKGLGRRLVSHLLDRAFRGHDLPSARMHVYGRNLPALRLYAKMGFAPYAMKIKSDYRGDPALVLNLRLRRDQWRPR